MIRLNHSIPLSLLALAVMSDCAIADPKYDFMLHGYIRSGILANAVGNRADSVGLMPDGTVRTTTGMMCSSAKVLPNCPTSTSRRK